MPSYSDTLNYIFNLRGGEVDLRLHRVSQALSLLGHPERRYPAFHIAGTNGKGSTAAMLHRILSTQGYRTALYTSPHVVSFTERIQVGDREISPEEVLELTEAIKVSMAQAGVMLTFFEFVTVMALTYFSHCEVDVAVIEVGMGGRLDATNLVTPEVSIITTIAKDHEAYLGSEIESIAQEKGGIIKSGVPVVCGFLPPEAGAVLESMARSRGSVSHFFGRDFSVALGENKLFGYNGLHWNLKDLSLALQGEYQKRNAAVALAALETIQAKFPVSEASVREGLKNVFWPARFEVVLTRPMVILDGAHNIQGITVLTQETRILLSGKKVRVLFGSMRDKDSAQMLKGLCEIASEISLTRVPMDRSEDPKVLRDSIPTGIPVNIVDDPVEAIRSLIKGAEGNEALLVTGSLYLMGRVRPFLIRMREAEILGAEA